MILFFLGHLKILFFLPVSWVLQLSGGWYCYSFLCLKPDVNSVTDEAFRFSITGLLSNFLMVLTTRSAKKGQSPLNCQKRSVFLSFKKVWKRLLQKLFSSMAFSFNRFSIWSSQNIWKINCYCLTTIVFQYKIPLMFGINTNRY